MTTAARPTFDPARGGQGRGEKDLSAISRQYSSRDLPGHTKLKYRYGNLPTIVHFVVLLLTLMLFALFIITENKGKEPQMNYAPGTFVKSWMIERRT